jgi:hypothetical protein
MVWARGGILGFLVFELWNKYTRKSVWGEYTPGTEKQCGHGGAIPGTKKQVGDFQVSPKSLIGKCTPRTPRYMNINTHTLF